MRLSDHQLQQYLEHIGFAGKPQRDSATLQHLHALHPLRIPFENLDSWRGHPVQLQPDTVFRKLVLDGRGGYCFEHNQLFRRVLESLGFQVQGLSARVLWMLPPEQILPRTHMALLVESDGERWLADVGFGGMTMTTPLQLDRREAQRGPHEALRLQQQDALYTVEVELNGSWQPMYRFSLEAWLPADYETSNWYVSTHPQSRFVQQLIASKPGVGCRHALLNRRYSLHRSGQSSQTQELASPAELLELLQQSFGIRHQGLAGLEARINTLFED
jgi:N-hydroxyarylamine O-acetyltransferase